MNDGEFKISIKPSNKVATSDIKHYISITKKQKDRIKKHIIEKIKTENGCTSFRTLSFMHKLPYSESVKLLKYHSGHEIHRKIINVEYALNLFATSLKLFTDKINQFNSESRHKYFFHKTNKEYLRKFELEINSLIFAFAAAAEALGKHSMRLSKKLHIREYDEKVRDLLLKHGDYSFIKDLRNNMAHQHVSRANYLIRDMGSNHQTTTYVYKKYELEGLDLSKQSLQFLESLPDEVDLWAIFDDYHRRVHDFYEWWFPEISKIIPPQAADMRRTMLELEGHARKTGIKAMISIWIQLKVDPYDHLHKYLSEDEITKALSLPKHTREQVDLIIEMTDEAPVCDTGIRHGLYKLFGVTNTTETRH